MCSFSKLMLLFIIHHFHGSSLLKAAACSRQQPARGSSLLKAAACSCQEHHEV
jgi:hypothetical protein